MAKTGVKKDNKTLDIKTVCECCHCLGSKTLHPQVSLINLEKPELEEDAVKFEFYAILLIEDCPDGCCCCGRKYYDYSVATMVFLTPGEIFRMSKEDTLPPKGWLLAFHPDLLFRTSLFLSQGRGVTPLPARDFHSDLSVGAYRRRTAPSD